VSQLFRPEALQHAASGARMDSDVLRLSPRWTRPTYWILVAAFIAALAYSVFGRVHEYATGPAIVRLVGREEITSTVAGTVHAVEVRPGQRVARGDMLVQFHAAKESAELERIEREIELQLVRTLRDPADVGAREALTSLQAQKELAKAKVAEFSIRAPRAGIVGDVRIRRGQLLTIGDIVVTMLPEAPRFTVVAMLPGAYRPQLAPGMSLRFEVAGYRYAYQELVVDTVGAQIVGPNEVKRYLGAELADTVRVDGPMVLVEARPASNAFQADGRSFDFYDGMNGLAEARVRKQRILVALVPALRIVFEEFGE
jgi:multidrug efflux pump subunit AcrA (membrane-fusion protein)